MGFLKEVDADILSFNDSNPVELDTLRLIFYEVNSDLSLSCIGNEVNKRYHTLDSYLCEEADGRGLNSSLHFEYILEQGNDGFWQNDIGETMRFCKSIGDIIEPDQYYKYILCNEETIADGKFLGIVTRNRHCREANLNGIKECLLSILTYIDGFFFFDDDTNVEVVMPRLGESDGVPYKEVREAIKDVLGSSDGVNRLRVIVCGGGENFGQNETV